jgi:predicted nucleic acid-binding Zn ribbon protein
MPLYKFRCGQCSAERDWFGPHKGQPVTLSCLKCGSEMRRTYGLPNMRFRPYKTDELDFHGRWVQVNSSQEEREWEKRTGKVRYR